MNVAMVLVNRVGSGLDWCCYRMSPNCMQELSIVQQATGEFGMASTHRREAAKNNKRSMRASTVEAPRTQRDSATPPRFPLRQRAA